MRAKELSAKNKPIVYVDMDGVLADLFGHVGGLHDVEHYNQMTSDQWEEFFKNSNAYELFRNLPAFSTANQLLQLVKQRAGGYTILSSPLNFDKAGSIKGKKEWLAKHITVSADGMIFDHEKYKYAKQPDGTPNVLIDDYGVNITKWKAAGGIPIKYQADENDLTVITKGLARAEHATTEPKHDLSESTSIHDHKDNFVDMFKKFLPLAMHYLKIDNLPEMKFEPHIRDTDQPTFGKYDNSTQVLHVALLNRHPNDILRTTAHELCHYKQDINDELNAESGTTGSPEENEAHVMAGIIMRHFNKQHPEYLDSDPITSNK